MGGAGPHLEWRQRRAGPGDGHHDFAARVADYATEFTTNPPLSTDRRFGAIHRADRDSCDSRYRFRLVTQSEADQLAGCGVGPRTPGAVCDLRPPNTSGPAPISCPGRLRDLNPQLLLRGGA